MSNFFSVLKDHQQNSASSLQHSHSLGVDPHAGLLSAAAASSRQVGLLAGHYMSSSTSSPNSSTTPPSSSAALAATSASSPIAANASVHDNNGALSHSSSGHQSAWPQACLDTFSSAAYNGQQAMAAAQAAAREAFYGTHWASSLGYAANANANAAMMNPSWNSYTLATYQGLQREGVTYGKYNFFLYNYCQN